MKVMVAPMKVGHNTRGSIGFIKRKNPRIFSLTEMDLGKTTALPAVRSVYGRMAAIYTRDLGQHSEECPIVVRRVPWVRVQHFRLHQLSEDGGPDVGGMGNDRWLAELEVKVWRKVWVIFATHVDAGVMHIAGPEVGKLLGTHAGRERWARYQNEMAKAEPIIAAAKRRADVVVLQGDLNMLPIGAGKTEHYSPHQTFSRLGMTYVNTRVVYQGVWGARIRKHQVFPPGKSGWGSDHGALMSWIRPK